MASISYYLLQLIDKFELVIHSAVMLSETNDNHPLVCIATPHSRNRENEWASLEASLNEWRASWR